MMFQEKLRIVPIKEKNLIKTKENYLQLDGVGWEKEEGDV